MFPADQQQYCCSAFIPDPVIPSPWPCFDSHTASYHIRALLHLPCGVASVCSDRTVAGFSQLGFTPFLFPSHGRRPPFVNSPGRHLHFKPRQLLHVFRRLRTTPRRVQNRRSAAWAQRWRRWRRRHRNFRRNIPHSRRIAPVLQQEEAGLAKGDPSEADVLEPISGTHSDYRRRGGAPVPRAQRDDEQPSP